MSFQLLAKTTVHINAPASKVWEALTTPAIIKLYFFGTDVITYWKVDSSLVFKGVWEGKPYEDKGTIIAIEPNKYLRYNYLSSMGSLPDHPENYVNITYDLNEDHGVTALTITQDHILTDEVKKQSEENWTAILKSLKELIEKDNPDI